MICKSFIFNGNYHALKYLKALQCSEYLINVKRNGVKVNSN